MKRIILVPTAVVAAAIGAAAAWWWLGPRHAHALATDVETAMAASRQAVKEASEQREAPSPTSAAVVEARRADRIAAEAQASNAPDDPVRH